MRDDDILYYKLFDRREVGALRSQVNDFHWQIRHDKEYIASLENKLNRQIFLNNFMVAAFCMAALFAFAFYFMFQQQKSRTIYLTNMLYATEVRHDAVTHELYRTEEKLGWLQQVTQFKPTQEGNWWIDNFEVTAYTNSPDEVAPYYDGFTAIGSKADWKRDIVAVDPKVVPLRSSMWIKGRGWVRAEDTGGDIKGRRIDILMEDKSQAFEYGRKNPVPVLILPPKNMPRSKVMTETKPDNANEVSRNESSWYKKAWGWIKHKSNAGT